jgi:hypothetical protein
MLLQLKQSLPFSLSQFVISDDQNACSQKSFHLKAEEKMSGKVDMVYVRTKPGE